MGLSNRAGPFASSVNISGSTLTIDQGARGADPWSIRENLDIGRVEVVISTEFAPVTTNDTIAALVKMTGGVNAAPATSIPVAAGKILRIMGGWFSHKGTAAGQQTFGTITLRQNPAGPTDVTSPSWGRISIFTTGTIVNA